MIFHLDYGVYCLIINTLLTLLNDSMLLINPMLIPVLLRVGNSSFWALKTLAEIIETTWIRHDQHVPCWFAHFLPTTKYWLAFSSHHRSCYYLISLLIAPKAWEAFSRHTHKGSTWSTAKHTTVLPCSGFSQATWYQVVIPLCYWAEPAATFWIHKNELRAPIFPLICYQKKKDGGGKEERKKSYYPQI